MLDWTKWSAVFKGRTHVYIFHSDLTSVVRSVAGNCFVTKCVHLTYLFKLWWYISTTSHPTRKPSQCVLPPPLTWPRAVGVTSAPYISDKVSIITALPPSRKRHMVSTWFSSQIVHPVFYNLWNLLNGFEHAPQNDSDWHLEGYDAGRVTATLILVTSPLVMLNLFQEIYVNIFAFFVIHQKLRSIG